MGFDVGKTRNHLVTLARERVAAHRITSSSSNWSWTESHHKEKKILQTKDRTSKNRSNYFNITCSALTPGLASLIALTSSFTRVSSRFCSVSAYLNQDSINNLFVQKLQPHVSKIMLCFAKTLSLVFHNSSELSHAVVFHLVVLIGRVLELPLP